MIVFRKKQGASMINVLVFFLMAMMVASQTFFFSASSLEATSGQSEAEQRRFAYERYLHDAIEAVRNPSGSLAITSAASQYAAAYSIGLAPTSIDIKTFYEQRRTQQHKEGNNVCYEIYDLNYTLVQNTNFAIPGYDPQDSFKEHGYIPDNLNQFVFPPMGENHYLIRVYEKYTDDWAARQKLIGQRLMYQVVVHKNGMDTPSVISFQEVWY